MDSSELFTRSTSKLVDLARQQVESGQELEKDILRELQSRYAWPDCPAEDIALIANLNSSVFIPLLGGYTKLPPRRRKSPGKMAPVPTHYQLQRNKNGLVQKSPRLSKLRSKLNDSQRDLLDLFWKHFLDDGRWPLRLDIHQEHPKQEIYNCLRSIGGDPALSGNIIQEFHSEHGPVYELSFIGILLTKNGEDYETWFVRLIEFFRDEYYQRKKERTVEIDEVKIRRILKLDKEELAALQQAARFAPFCQSHGHTLGGNWKIRSPHDIDETPKTGSIITYFEEGIFKYFDIKKWAFEKDRKISPLTFGNALATGHQDLVLPSDKTELTEAATSLSNGLPLPKIFISHSNQDKKFVQALIDLLKTAFTLKSKDILCTSVPGHKLPGGADTEEALLDLLGKAQLLIGLLTPASLESSYVLFELGARWGLKKSLISLVGCGTKMHHIKEPLKSKNSLNATDEDDLHQLIEDVAKCLQQKSEPPSVYNGKIRRLVELAGQTVQAKE